jgi:hypothetical protein
MIVIKAEQGMLYIIEHIDPLKLIHVYITYLKTEPFSSLTYSQNIFRNRNCGTRGHADDLDLCGFKLHIQFHLIGFCCGSAGCVSQQAPAAAGYALPVL